MNKFLLTIFCLIFYLSYSQAQTDFGVKGGVNITFFKVDEINFGEYPDTEIGFYDSTGANGSYIGHRGSADLVMRSSAGAMRFGTFANSQLVNLVGSNVGIGTASPLNPLHVAGAARLDGDLVFTGTGFVNNNAGDIEIATVSNKNILFNPDGTGNVGIGTTSPAAKLDVNGGVRVADDAATASATNVGTLRYRTSGNNSYVDMCMQTGAATYAWVNIVQNNW